jgi:hypothetical protein
MRVVASFATSQEFSSRRWLRCAACLKQPRKRLPDSRALMTRRRRAPATADAYLWLTRANRHH